jgi:phage-related tail fiber protein
MQNEFFTILTAYGLARDAAYRQGGASTPLLTMAVGDGGGAPVVPSEAQTALVREVYRAPITDCTRDSANPGCVIAELTIPADVGGWTAQEVGIYDDTGALYAVGNLPATFKPAPASGASKQLTLRMYLATSNAASIIIIVDPNLNLPTRQWVLDQIGGAGADADFVLTFESELGQPAGAIDGGITWSLGTVPPHRHDADDIDSALADPVSSFDTAAQ